MPDVAWRSYSYTVYKSDRGTKRARIIPDVAWRGYIQIRQGYKADKNYSGCTHGAAIYTNHTGVQSGQELFRMYAWRSYIQITQGYKAGKNYSGCTHGAAIYTSGQELFVTGEKYLLNSFLKINICIFPVKDLRSTLS